MQLCLMQDNCLKLYILFITTIIVLTWMWWWLMQQESPSSFCIDFVLLYLSCTLVCWAYEWRGRPWIRIMLIPLSQQTDTRPARQTENLCMTPMGQESVYESMHRIRLVVWLKYWDEKFKRRISLGLNRKDKQGNGRRKGGRERERFEREGE